MSHVKPVNPSHIAGALLLSLLLFFCTVPISFASVGPTSSEYGVVLNLSGKQRMLSQKMSKEIMLVALGIDTENNLQNLANTSGLFDKTLKGLRNGSAELKLPPTNAARILRQLNKVDAIWAGFYPVVQTIIKNKAVTKEQVATVAKSNLPLLKEMNKTVGLYEKDAKKGGLKSAPGLAATLNLSGKQRMLTQKMSKEFLLVAYGHEVDDNKLSLLETYSLFERTLKGLRNGDTTLGLPATKQPHILAQLDVIEGLWAKFKPIVAYGADHKTTSIPKDKIEILASTNLPLLKEMNKAVGMYAKEAGK